MVKVCSSSSSRGCININSRNSSSNCSSSSRSSSSSWDSAVDTRLRNRISRSPHSISENVGDFPISKAAGHVLEPTQPPMH